MPKPLRIGTLGAARITPMALIHPANALGRVTVTAVAARDKARARAFAAEHKIPAVHDSYEALLADPEIDLVYNPLPIDQHAPWSIAAMEAGKPVLCEKPFAMNAGEVQAMLAASERTGKRLIEAFHYRYHPAFDTCLTWVRSGLIGTVKAIDAVFHVPIKDDGAEIRHRPENGGGAMMDLGCYPVSWVLSLLDAAPETVTASGSLTPSGVDERLSGRLGFSGGVTASVSADMAPDVAVKIAMTVEGTEGVIDFQRPLAPHWGGALTLRRTGEPDVSAAISPITTYTYQLAAVVSALETGDPLPTEAGSMLLRQQETLDRLYAAAGFGHLRAMGHQPDDQS
ncbi:MAG: Gfo/Idh/MocA family oxidoreductase [Pseudomonadota bacterium]